MFNFLLGVRSFKRTSGSGAFSAPEDSIFLWYGNSEDLSEGFSIFITDSRIMIMGADSSGSSLIISGSSIHTHTIPNTNTTSNHVHDFIATSGGASATKSWTTSGAYATGSSGHTHSINKDTGSGGGHSHTINTSGSSTNLPPYFGLYYIKSLNGSSELPINSIIMYSGLEETIPDGWKICNGSMGTPDLRGKFVYSAINNGHIGDFGGLSQHDHISPASTNNAGSHTHSIGSGTTSNSSAAGTSAQWFSAGAAVLADHPHTHSYSSTTTSSDSNHSHTLSPLSLENILPPYKKLYYLMRVT